MRMGQPLQHHSVFGARALLACAVWLSVVLSACGADEYSHPQRVTMDVCDRRGGTYVASKYCVVTDAAADGGMDGGVDAMTSEAGPDAGDGGGDTLDGMTGDGGPGSDGSMGDAQPPLESCPEEGKEESCYSLGDRDPTQSQPPCKSGTRECKDGLWSECTGDVLPGKESCNDMDDDCDGRTDEGLVMQTCTLDESEAKGECRAGFQVCRQGMADCIQIVFPQADTCNDKDDDCDGMTDEGTEVDCYDGSTGCTNTPGIGYTCEGICVPGTKMCVSGAYEADCHDAVTPMAAEVNTTSGQQVRDEDCDGETDEGFSCTNGTMFSCYTGAPGTEATAPCQTGQQTCMGGTLEDRPCVGEVTPVPESCANAGVDNDCNGMNDDVPMLGASCASMSTGRGVCKTLATFQCDSNAGADTVCKDAAPSAEVCDGQGQDEDCDGNTDEGFNKQTDENHCGVCGNKCAAGRTCCGGSCVDTQTSNTNCNGCGLSCGGNTCCGGACKNLTNDKTNCGSCGNNCGLLGLTSSCTNSKCTGLGI
jgi:hypothetical protein